MAGGCRDCGRCTESALATMLWAPFRLLGWVCGGFALRFVRKTCPQCGHVMSGHKKLAGRFAD
jgi:hypothetical protein